jgi:hypothetical protein
MVLLLLEVVVVLVVIAQTLVVWSEIGEWSGRPLGVAVVIGADAVGNVTRARWAGPSLGRRIAMSVYESQMRGLGWRQKVGRLRDG